MATLPQIDAPSVAPQALRLPEADPNAFGANVGKGLSQLGADVGAVVTQERHLAAVFDAQDRELSYGVEHDKLRLGYEKQILEARAGPGFQEAAASLAEQFSTDQEKLRAKFESTLNDPLAKRNYAVRTRVQTQMAERQMLMYADSHVGSWRKSQVETGVKLDNERAGNLTGDLNTDLHSLQDLRASTADKVAALHQDGLSRVEAEEKLRLADREKAITMVKGYNERKNHDAAIAFLDATLPDRTHVTYDPNQPNEPYLFTTAESQEIRNKMLEAKAENKAKDRQTAGMAYALDNYRSTGLSSFQEMVAKKFKDDPIAADAALTHFSKYQGEIHTAVERARQAATEQAQADILKDPQHFDPTTLDPKKVNISQLTGLATRTQAYVARPIVEKVGGIINDPTAAGYSSAISFQDLHGLAVTAGIPDRTREAWERAYRKDAAMSVAASKAPDHSKGVQIIDDAVRNALGVASVSGKNLTDLPPGWKQDVWHWATIEYAKRLSDVGEPGKAIPAQQSLQIATDIANEVKNKKEEARKSGKLAMPAFTPKGKSEPTAEQKQAASALVMALKGSQAGPEAVATITSDAEFNALPSGSAFKGPDGVLRRKP